MDSWFNTDSPKRLELIFRLRNKNFGAYPIRKNYKRRLAFSILLTCIFIFMLFLIQWTSRILTGKNALSHNIPAEEISFAEPPPIDKSIPLLPPLIPPRPELLKTIKFTPPEVVKDEEFVDETLPTQVELNNTLVSTVTQEGKMDVTLPFENPLMTEPDEEKVFTMVQEKPSFPGGEDEMINYLQKNIVYPQLARDNSIQGKVFITFSIDKNGRITNSKVLRGIGGGCDEEALRVFNSMPDWKAGKQNGMKVNVKGIVIYVEFRLR